VSGDRPICRIRQAVHGNLVGGFSVTWSAMDLEDAAEIAEEFRRGRDSPMSSERAELEGKARILEFDVGFLTIQIRRVTVDNATGKILGYDTIIGD